jgi:hypothetical protein
MKKFTLIFSILSILLLGGCANNQNLQAGILDKDNDGVLDSYDKCPNTPFTQLVDASGCPLK